MKDLAQAMKELRADIERILNLRGRKIISSNVPADVAERLSDAANDFDTFDEYDDEHIGAVLPYELQKPVAELLHLKNMLELARRVEGMDKDKAIDMTMEGLDHLYRACVERFNSL